MTRTRTAASLAICLLVLSACQTSSHELSALIGSPTAVARERRLGKELADHDTTVEGGAPLAEWLLPHALQEISGLALTSDDRLLVHDDELGQVWEIDYRRGVLVKRFSIGRGVVKGDFEGITVANGAVLRHCGQASCLRPSMIWLTPSRLHPATSAAAWHSESPSATAGCTSSMKAGTALASTIRSTTRG